MINKTGQKLSSELLRSNGERHFSGVGAKRQYAFAAADELTVLTDWYTHSDGFRFKSSQLEYKRARATSTAT